MLSQSDESVKSVRDREIDELRKTTEKILKLLSDTNDRLDDLLKKLR